ncbi:haloalkane dehalogenase [uncultured Shewanella sp.]|uniref:haloalkane dehalogenase n=1 Tax=uncultured Shewanella sp. TaxID=173975 RepID=UPI00260EFBDA|nr:haloalkane dehalogenase [uncultured Shewanella sp.]
MIKPLKKTIETALFASVLTLTACAPNSAPPQNQEEKIASINADFPFDSHYINIKGSKMHYIDEGHGDPILFLHGNPTSSYLWRNIIPYVSHDARAIAVDLIGMGKSDKPNIEYSFEDQATYLEAFINKLNLKNITLVVHDWGSGLGFNYAALNENNIKGIVFMESLIKPFTWESMPKEGAAMIKQIKTPGVGENMIMKQNFFIEMFLPNAIIRPLTQAEMDYYRSPYPTPESRKPIWKWPTEIPISGKPNNVHKIVSHYQRWLQETNLPMLLLNATPGMMIQENEVNWVKNNIRNVQVINIGRGLHFIQEDNPDAIGTAISSWYNNANNFKF